MKIIIIATLFPFILSGMEKKSECTIWKIPKEICAMIAGHASHSGIVSKMHARHFDTGTSALSTNWNNLQMNGELFMQQFWWRAQSQEDLPRFRYDDYSTQDCNQFWYRNDITSSKRLLFDGPTINGTTPGIIAVAHSFFYKSSEDSPYTALYLFKPSGIAAKDYAGAQKKMAIIGGGVAIAYDTFACSWPFLMNKKAVCLALARQKLIALHTLHAGGNWWIPKLHIFSYEMHQNKNSQKLNEQPYFTLKKIISGNTNFNIPFKKIAWIYGKALMVLDDGSAPNLAIIPIDENNNIKFLPQIQKIALREKQKIPLKVKNFAVHQPHQNHEIIFTDSENTLYFAALNDRTADNKIRYRKIWDKPTKFFIDQLWFYNDTICAMDLSGQCKFLRLGHDKTFTANDIQKKLLPLFKIIIQKKKAVCNEEGLVFDDYEPINL